MGITGGGDTMTAVVFKGINTLNFQEVRMNIVRVPEVLSSIKKAQRIWNENSEKYFDVLNFIASEDAVFSGDEFARNISKAVIKIGLYHRFIRKFPFPKFLIGDISDDLALLNCAGQLSIEKLIKDSILQERLQFVKDSDPGVVTLAGNNLEDWSCYEFNEKNARFEEKELASNNLSGAIDELLKNKKVKQVVNIGPDTLSGHLKIQLERSPLDFIEALDQDQQLDWFWPSMKNLGESIAN
jgi:hypothetical protein